MSDAQEFKDRTDLEGKKYFLEFENGKLVTIDTDDETLRTWAKSKGLTP